MLESEDTSVSLMCIKTAFVLISSHLQLAHIDLNPFVSHFYAQLPIISLAFGSDLELLDSLVEFMLFKTRDVQTKRLAAFAKRLASCSLVMWKNTSIPVINLLYKLTQRYPDALLCLLDTEFQLRNGKYLQLCSDPDRSNALASSMYELDFLSRHYSSSVAAAALRFGNQKLN